MPATSKAGQSCTFCSNLKELPYAELNNVVPNANLIINATSFREF